MKETLLVLHFISPGHAELTAYSFGYQGRVIQTHFSLNLKATACIIMGSYSLQLEMLILSLEIALGDNATIFKDS